MAGTDATTSIRAGSSDHPTTPTQEHKKCKADGFPGLDSPKEPISMKYTRLVEYDIDAATKPLREASDAGDVPTSFLAVMNGMHSMMQYMNTIKDAINNHASGIEHAYSTSSLNAKLFWKEQQKLNANVSEVQALKLDLQRISAESLNNDARLKATLDAQIDELAGNEPKLIENFKNAPIPIRQVPAGDTEAVIAEFDKIWLPKAPVLAELRKVGATL